MSNERPTVIWHGHDHADAYLLTATHHLARGASRPVTLPMTPPSVSATLNCAFAAEAYINVALIRTLGDEEYEHLSQIRVRSKYFLSTRLGAREAWFSEGESTLEALSELFTQRNRLVHAQPERSILHPFSDPEAPDLHTDLRNVARWINATADAVCRLSESHAELGEMDRVARPVHDMLLSRFDPDQDGPRVERAVKDLVARLLDEDDLGEAAATVDLDWDFRGLHSED